MAPGRPPHTPVAPGVLAVGEAFLQYMDARRSPAKVDKESLRESYQTFKEGRVLSCRTNFSQVIYTLKCAGKVSQYKPKSGRDRDLVMIDLKPRRPAAQEVADSDQAQGAMAMSPQGAMAMTPRSSRQRPRSRARQPRPQASADVSSPSKSVAQAHYVACQVCPDVVFPSMQAAKQSKHAESVGHHLRIALMALGEGTRRCPFCKAPVEEGQLSPHMMGECRMVFINRSLAREATTDIICGICNEAFLSQKEKETHEASSPHQIQKLIVDYRLLGKQVKIDKGGIRIAAAMETGPQAEPEPVTATRDDKFILRAVQRPSVVGLQFIIRNHNEVGVTLLDCCFLPEFPGSSLLDWGDRRLAGALPHLLHRMSKGPECKVIIKCRFKVTTAMRATIPLTFTFHKPGSPPFQIVKEITVTTAPEEEEKLLQPTAPYRPVPLPRRKGRDMRTIDPGEKPPGGSIGNKLASIIPLNEYKIPSVFEEFLRGSEEAHDTVGSTYGLFDLLKPANYASQFNALLYLEEHQMKIDMDKYEMKGDKAQTMEKCANGKFRLKVPGLAEKRPSLLRGDKVFVTVPGDVTMKYESYVHEVEMEHVILGFSQRFGFNVFVKGMKLEISYVLNRYPMKMMHRALDTAMGGKAFTSSSLSRLLFPSGLTLTSRSLPVPSLRVFNRDIESNEEQKRAIMNILNRTAHPAPFLIFGPPGTGKTVTLVEAIKQVYHRQPHSIILACAPQNFAADLVAKRLLAHIDPRHIVRLNATSRNVKDVRSAFPEVVDVSNFDGDEVYYPSKEELMQKRIIVSTLVTAGRLASAAFPSDHFTHLFVDECGHAMEPEALVALAGLHSDKCHVVLAGDPEQLGAVIRSREAIQYGLGVSLLERLMKQCDLYQPAPGRESDAYDSRVLVKLVKNYRSHKHILTVPNTLFYSGELVAFADEMSSSRYANWSELPRPGFPLIFHGITGQDMQEETSPSFFNPDEVICVGEYLKKLVQLKSPKFRPQDIGIITPYRKQVHKMRNHLRTLERKAKPLIIPYTEIRVGSVEEFQGQEREVIIISTVRSPNDHYLKMDKDFQLGFLNNPKRFNVAVTRAKSLLVVIGNPFVLQKDKFWRSFILYCETGSVGKSASRARVKSACVGVRLPPEESGEEGEKEDMDLLRQLETLHLDTSHMPDDPPWRDFH